MLSRERPFTFNSRICYNLHINATISVVHLIPEDIGMTWPCGHGVGLAIVWRPSGVSWDAFQVPKLMVEKFIANILE